tara:strand:+ start:10639 stop:10905 length:267 start_codon:yes stop_codon:yes gene_type:complete
MDNVINFIANQNFLNYLKMIGFKHQHVARTRKLYFTNRIGAQIRIDLKGRSIALLDKAGYLIASSPAYNNVDIQTFAKTFKLPTHEKA